MKLLDKLSARPEGQDSDAAVQSERKDPLHDQLARFDQLCDTIDKISSSDKLRLPAAERHLRSIRRALEEVNDQGGRVSSRVRRSREKTVRRLQRSHTTLLGRVRELRDFAEWQEWANLGIQEELCAKCEALTDVSDDAAFARLFRDIMAQWRQVADVPKARGEKLWIRFKAAHDISQPRHQAYLTAQVVNREREFRRRFSIIEEAEQLTSSTDWLKTSQRFTELQAKWKEMGPVPRRQQRETSDRFRAACNTFFTRRKDDLAKRKQEWARNLEEKETLIGSLEALSNVADITAAIEQVKQVQVKWRTIGSVRRKQSEALWQRFRSACDVIFERARTAEQEVVADKVAISENLCGELEALVLPDGDTNDPPDQLAATVGNIQKRWRQSPDLPHAVRRTVAVRFGQAINRVIEVYPDAFRGTALDPARQLKRLEELCRRVETFVQEETPSEHDVTPAEMLATKWRDALASNTMGVRVDEAAERRAAIDEVKRLQAERRRIGQLPGEEARGLTQRFQRACDRLFEAKGPSGTKRLGQ